tara:strand:+ start:1782 stop:1913 length:132 start_codon:yes stop_codon:yes gene_type:complete
MAGGNEIGEKHPRWKPWGTLRVGVKGYTYIKCKEAVEERVKKM